MLSEDELKSKRCAWHYCPLRTNGLSTAASTSHKGENIYLTENICCRYRCVIYGLRSQMICLFKKKKKTYWAFLFHLQNVVDVIFLWRASGPLPLQTQPGHPCHLQLWREGWQWHTAWGEQVHHFTELAGEGRETESGREWEKETGGTEWETHMCTQMRAKNGTNSNINMDNRQGTDQGII